MELTQKLKDWLVENSGVSKNASDETFKKYLVHALQDDSLVPEKFAELLGEKDASSAIAKLRGSVRVKAESEKYSSKRWSAKHSKTGESVRNERGQVVESPSELDNAKSGVLLKHLAKKSGVSSISLDEHEENLLTELAESDEWCGEQNGQYKFGIPATKALLDDVSSGGLEISPIFFDEQLISFPLLHGELFPFVDLVELPRGRRIEGGSIGNPSVSWGTPDGTAMSVFDTAGLVSALDSTVYTATVAIEIGLDFLSDSPSDVGRILTANIGQRFMAELDKVIASGDGTTQPQGIANASGITTITTSNGNPGPPVVADFESLMFSVGKQYRGNELRPAFIANDTSYSRARGIAVGASDQRRVFGMDEQSYSLLQYPFRVQNDLANTVAFFGSLAKYRMYRRLGFSLKMETGGKELTLKNLALLTVRSRYAGRVVDANAFVKWTDGQS